MIKKTNPNTEKIPGISKKALVDEYNCKLKMLIKAADLSKILASINKYDPIE
jgi:hypothetical protein